MTSVAPVQFDTALVTVEHKLDIDAYEDGCITSLVFDLQRGAGCRLRVEAGERIDLGGHLGVLSASFEPDSQCPSFPDDTDGTYTSGTLPGSGIILAAPNVPGPNVAESCFSGQLVIQLAGELRREDGATLLLDGTAITLTGTFRSEGQTTGSCPCAASCDGLECGDDGNPCTADACSGAAACAHTPQDTPSEPTCERA